MRQLAFVAMLLGAIGYAGIRGGSPERLTAGALVAAALSTRIYAHIRPPNIGLYSSMEIWVAVIDLALFAAVLAIAITSSRFWPMLMASMLGCELFGHLAKSLGPDILPKAYYVTVAFWGYPTVILLAVATWRHQVRLKRYGIDYPWVWRLPRRYRDGWSVDELARASPQP
ncbi:MAG TPA: hypothetical protein VNT42_06725 [Sphingomonas sp.]|nr:hypothetical protein [Sphingomonas sp.]